VLRERGHAWNSRPAAVLLAAMLAAAGLATLFAWAGWFMAPLPGWIVATLYGTSLGFGLVLDSVKVAVLRRLPIDRR